MVHIKKTRRPRVRGSTPPARAACSGPGSQPAHTTPAVVQVPADLVLALAGPSVHRSQQRVCIPL